VDKPLTEPQCEHCGAYEPTSVGGRWLCVDCYQTCGACCSEIGKDAPEQGE
jgi:hypothetical protein